MTSNAGVSITSILPRGAGTGAARRVVQEVIGSVDGLSNQGYARTVGEVVVAWSV